jgi:hypothetical protein
MIGGSAHRLVLIGGTLGVRSRFAMSPSRKRLTVEKKEPAKRGSGKGGSEKGGGKKGEVQGLPGRWRLADFALGTFGSSRPRVG